MKFEIDDKTGMVAVEENGFIISSDDENTEVIWARSSELEKILQAVKKTQEKLVNKQIQDIQDSKNYISLEPNEALEFVEVDPQIIKAVGHENDVEISKGNFVPIKKIEQNQKIVDTIIKLHTKASTCVNELDSDTKHRLEFLVHKATGKDIKDL